MPTCHALHTLPIPSNSPQLLPSIAYRRPGTIDNTATIYSINTNDAKEQYSNYVSTLCLCGAPIILSAESTMTTAIIPDMARGVPSESRARHARGD